MRKKQIIYGLAAMGLLCAVGLLQWPAGNSADWLYWLSQIVVLGLGILHVRLLGNFFFGVVPENFGRNLLVTVILMLGGGVLMGILYYFIHLDYAWLGVLPPFLLPLLCRYTYLLFLSIPSAVYKLWYYPIDQGMPDLDMVDLSQVEVVQFVFSKSMAVNTATNFTAKAPLHMSLGQLFFILINDYNEKNAINPIQYLYSDDSPAGWLFYRKRKWFGRRSYFDPERSFHDNTIIPNELIYAFRVREALRPDARTL